MLTLLTLLAGCGTASSPEPSAAVPARSSGSSTLTWEGLGEVHYGMDRAAAETALGRTLYGEDSAECHYLSPKPPGEKPAVELMFDGGTLKRIDVHGPSVLAEGGAHVGMKADEVRALYPGRITEQPDKYDDGSYLIVAPPEPGEAKLIFEVAPSGRVRELRGGLPPHVDYVEGCS